MITIFFQSVELVTLINVTSGNDHNFFLVSGIGHIFKFQQWTLSQFFLYFVELVTFSNETSGNDHNFSPMSGNDPSFFHQSSYF